MPSLTDVTADDPTTFADLPEAERTLLWSMRVWVIGHCRQQEVSTRIAAALGELGVERSLADLESFMVALSRGASRPIALLCLCRTEVSADERLLLDAFALLQQDEADDAQILLCSFLTERAATIAIRSAEALAQEFFDAGASLQPDPTVGGRPAVASMPRVLH